MLNNKRGLSAIVTTLIIILLTIVSIGIVWVVVRNVLTGGTEGLDWNAKCLAADVRAIRLNCSASPAVCTVALKRQGSGADVLGGVKLVFKNDTAGLTSSVLTFTGDVPALVETKTTQATGIASTTKVEVTPFFTDTGGNAKYCTTASYP